MQNTKDKLGGATERAWTGGGRRGGGGKSRVPEHSQEAGRRLVADIMRRAEPIVPAHLTIAAARKVAALKRAQRLFVEQHDRVVGLLDERALTDGNDDAAVGDYMRSIAAVVAPTDALRRARAALELYGVPALPVVAGMFLVGSISRNDVERALAGEPRDGGYESPRLAA